MDDDAIFDMIFDPDESEGAIELTWEVATRCVQPRVGGAPCIDPRTRQPNWECTNCGGLGAEYSAPVTVYGLFRGQSKWKRQSVSGEHALGEAQLTTALEVKPGWTDDRVRDRFTVPIAVADFAAGTVFYCAAKPVPFLFAGEQRAWRCTLQSADQTSRTRPQP